MNYYIQGDAAKADQIKAAFEKLGYNTRNLKFTSSQLYYTIEGEVQLVCSNAFQNLVKTHPDYKELELPVEPKFKVGDWIACNADSFILSIKSVRDENYYFHQGASLPIKDIDEHYHLWSIADAKDGDILMSDKGNPFIFCEDRIHAGYHNIIAYCGITTMGNFCESSRKECWTYGTSLKPATKEQVTLLFAKMREAGYQWDADKKELKKIQTHYDIKNFHAGMPVLVRMDNSLDWSYALFSHYSKGWNYPFRVSSCCSVKQCIPYNGNEHLLGTTDMPSEEYINW